VSDESPKGPRLRKQADPRPSPASAPAPRNDGAGDYEVTRLVSAGSGADAAPMPKLDPGPRFLLTWHPHQWHVQGGKLVPMITELPLCAGINGIKEERDGSTDDTRAVQIRLKRGYRIIPQGIDAAAGHPSYVKRVKVRQTVDGKPIYAYMTRWQRVPAGSSQVLFDEPGYVAWCDGLVKSGTIPPPDRWVLETLEGKLLDHIGRVEDKAQQFPSESNRLARLRSDLSVVRAALAAMDDGSDIAEYEEPA
jgi:hypothetical protein